MSYPKLSIKREKLWLVDFSVQTGQHHPYPKGEKERKTKRGNMNPENSEYGEVDFDLDEKVEAPKWARTAKSESGLKKLESESLNRLKSIDPEPVRKQAQIPYPPEGLPEPVEVGEPGSFLIDKEVPVHLKYLTEHVLYEVPRNRYLLKDTSSFKTIYGTLTSSSPFAISFPAESPPVECSKPLIDLFIKTAHLDGVINLSNWALERFIPFVKAAIDIDAEYVLEQALKPGLVGPKVLVLAVAISSENKDVKNLGKAYFYKICDNSRKVLRLISFLKELGGLGRGKRKLIADWYLSVPPEVLSQAVIRNERYRGYTHKTAIRLIHPETKDPARQALLRWVTGSNFGEREVGRKTNMLVKSYDPVDINLLPKTALNKINGKPPELTMDLIIERMRSSGMFCHLLEPDKVLGVINSSESDLMGAFITYCHHNKYCRNDEISAALFGLTERAIKNSPKNPGTVGVVVNLSYEMFNKCWRGTEVLTAEIAKILAFYLCSSYEKSYSWAFYRGLSELNIDPKRSLEDFLRLTRDLPFGLPDCSLPMRVASEAGLDIDHFIILTDKEWHLDIGPEDAIKEYNQKMGKDSIVSIFPLLSESTSYCTNKMKNVREIVGFKQESSLNIFAT